MLVVLVAALGLSTAIPAAAESKRAPDSADAAAASAVIQADIASLVPATVALATPVLCGGLTVYDQEDVSTLCSPTTLAATPIVSPTCPQVVSGSVRLETDLLCTNTDGLIVGSDNTVIDLNGHRIVCTGEPAGYFGSCQGPLPATLDDVGVDTANFANVHVYSHVPGGTIDGFDIGVDVRAGSDNVKVKQLTVTGPTGGPPGNFRPRVFGIRVAGDHCDGGTVRIGGGTSTGNDVSNHTEGIRLTGTSCVYVGYNTVHDNRDWENLAFAGVGIRLSNSPDNHIRSNVVTENGDDEVDVTLPDSGILVNGAASAANLLVENQSNGNRGEGIATTVGAATNDIVNNQMLFNSPPLFVDAYSDQSGVNTWNENNRCQTQTTPQPPPGVCNPGEVPPPQ